MRLLLPLAFLACTGPVFAQEAEPTDAVGKSALMRQCAQTHEGDAEIAAIGVGSFCQCYVGELAADADKRPEVYFDEGPKKPYYSAREEAIKATTRAQAFESHVSYCKTILR